jgi:sn1-specific diacylglycerol lipase
MTLVLMSVRSEDWEMSCMAELHELTIGFVIILVSCILLESWMLVISMRGTIMQVEKRNGLPWLIYVRLMVLVIELVWISLSAIWLNRYYTFCFTRTAAYAKDTLLGITVTSCILIGVTIVAITCSFDCSGSSAHADQSKRYKQRGRRRIDDQLDHQKQWWNRCRILICCLHDADRHHVSTRVFSAHKF